MKTSFCVVTKGNSDLEEAIQSYVFNLFALGLQVPKSGRGVAELEYRVYEAFRGLMKEFVVDIDVEENTNSIKINLL